MSIVSGDPVTEIESAQSPAIQPAARTAPLAKASREVATCPSSNRSPSPAIHTV